MKTKTKSSWLKRNVKRSGPAFRRPYAPVMGFTLIELPGGVAILAPALQPAASFAKQQAQGAYCMGAQKRLTLARKMQPAMICRGQEFMK
jgi:hypothetical protein